MANGKRLIGNRQMAKSAAEDHVSKLPKACLSSYATIKEKSNNRGLRRRRSFDFGGSARVVCA